MKSLQLESGGPLEGWRVLELAEGTAACFCGKVLADLGAEVVMVEPPGGHVLRSAEPCRDDGVSGRFLYLASGKHSAVVDPDEGADPDEGNSRWQRLIEEADLVVTDADLVHFDELTRGCPERPVVFVRPFGLSGPYAGHRAHHLTVFHAAGESSTLPSGQGFEQFPERPPLQLGSEIGYFDAGWNAALVALALLHDGNGPARADVSVHEAELSLSRTRLNRYLNEGACVGREGRRYGIAGMLACNDGWIQLVGMRDEHWDRLVQTDEGRPFQAAGFGTAAARAERTEGLGALLARWCEQRSKFDAVEVLSRVGAPVGIFADPADCLSSEQLAHRRFFQEIDDGTSRTVTLPGPPYKFSGTPLSSRPAPAMGASSGFSPRQGRPTGAGNQRLLEGVRVLDFTWAAAGPYATLLLGFLGAEIVKVESSTRPDPARRGFLTRYDGADNSPIFNELNLDKRSVRIDLSQPESLPIIRDVVGSFDVVVDNFRPGVMERLGLGAETLLAAHPHLVVASSSANGSTGPEAMGAGLASIFAASGGLSVQTGYPDGPPTEVSDTMDYRNGTVLAVAILAALLQRVSSGCGQRVDLSSREVVLASAPDALLAHALGVAWPLRVGNGHRTMALHGVYGCADGGWVAIAVGTEKERASLKELIEIPDGCELEQAIMSWVRRLPAREAAARLQAHGVAAAPVMTFAALAQDPHLTAREVFVEVEHPKLGIQRVMRAPWRFLDRQLEVPGPAPLLGADNDEILKASRHARGVSNDRRAEVFC